MIAGYYSFWFLIVSRVTIQLVGVMKF